LLQGASAILSQHQGDLDDAATFDDYRASLALYARLFDHEPRVLVADRHPGYRSSRLASERALAEGLPLVLVQHHHAHAAACLAEHGWPLHGPKVLAIVLDGLGLGDDGALWGGEFLLADYRASTRLGSFEPVAMIGGDQASREPWRNLYAHLMARLGWPAFASKYAALEVYQRLAEKPRALLDGLLRAGLNTPLASSCGRLFDAFAAAIGVAFERQAYEGQAGALLEAIVCEAALRDEDEALAYPFTIAPGAGGMPCVEPTAMWSAALGDLVRATPRGVMSARFHRGLARAIAAMALALSGSRDASPGRFDTVALSGGCFQNRVLFEEVARRLRAHGFHVLSHTRVPPNDGGLALGQATIAAARLLEAGEERRAIR
jgi:hydrogenase maturation protein HypF